MRAKLAADFGLEPCEARMLMMLMEYGQRWVTLPSMTIFGRRCLDALVLSGLAERRKDKNGEWRDEWRTTEEAWKEPRGDNTATR